MSFNFYSSNGCTIANNKLTYSESEEGPVTVYGDKTFESGCHSWEFQIINSSSPCNIMLGVCDPTIHVKSDKFLSHGPRGYAYYAYYGDFYTNSKSTSYGQKFGQGDLIKIMIDMENGTLEFFLNGKTQGVAYTQLTGPLVAAVTLYAPEDQILYLPGKQITKFQLAPTDSVVLENNDLTATCKVNNSITFGTTPFESGKHFWSVKVNQVKNMARFGLASETISSLEQTPLTFTSLSMFAPISIENGTKLSQKQEKTFSVISKQTLTCGYWEFRVGNAIGSDWMTIGLSSAYREITPSGSLQNNMVNWIGLRKGEFSYSLDGQVFLNGETNPQHKDEPNYCFKKDDVFGLLLWKGMVKISKNGKEIHSVQLETTGPFYAAVTLFGESACLESIPIEFNKNWFDISCFVYNSDGTFTNAGKTQPFGPSFKQGDDILFEYESDSLTVYLNGSEVGQVVISTTKSLIPIMMCSNIGDSFSLDPNRKSLFKEVSQWVRSISGFSSCYQGWPAENVIGPSNTYPNYGDFKTAWAPQSSSGTVEYLELEYDLSIVPKSIKIYETYHPGACVKVSGLFENEWQVLWEGSANQDQLEPKARIFAPKLKTMKQTCNKIRLEFDCRRSPGFYEVDAVMLMGYQMNPELDTIQGLEFVQNKSIVTCTANGPITTSCNYLTPNFSLAFEILKFVHYIKIGGFDGTLQHGDIVQVVYSKPTMSYYKNGLLVDEVKMENWPRLQVVFGGIGDCIKMSSWKAPMEMEMVSLGGININNKWNLIADKDDVARGSIASKALFFSATCKKTSETTQIGLMDSLGKTFHVNKDPLENGSVYIVSLENGTLSWIKNGATLHSIQGLKGFWVPFVKMNAQDELIIDPNAIDETKLRFLDVSNGITFSNKNQTVSVQDVIGEKTCFGSRTYTEKQVYFAFSIQTTTNNFQFGFADSNVLTHLKSFLGNSVRGWALCANGELRHNMKTIPFMSALRVGDKVGFAIDFDKSSCDVYLNDNYVGRAFTNVTGPIQPCVSLYHQDTITIVDDPLPETLSSSGFLGFTGVTLSNFGQTITHAGLNKSALTTFGNMIYTSGKHYFAFKVEFAAESPSNIMIGVADTNVHINQKTFISHSAKGWAYYAFNGNSYHNSKAGNYSLPFGTGSEIGVSLDLDNKTLEYYKDGEYCGQSHNNVIGPVRFGVTLYATGDKVTYLPNAKMPQIQVVDSVGPFKLGAKFLMKSYYGTYAHYNPSHSPAPLQVPTKDAIFTVDVKGSRFRFTDPAQHHLTAETGNVWFKVTELKDPLVNGYTLQSPSGKYLGIGTDAVLRIYADCNNFNTRWFPEVPAKDLLGVGSFIDGAVLVLRSKWNHYLRHDFQTSSIVTEENKFRVEQTTPDTFKLVNLKGNYLNISAQDPLIVITEFNEPFTNGYALKNKDNKFLGINTLGQVIVVDNKDGWESRFFPFDPKVQVGPFKDGVKIILKTHWNTYFYYDQVDYTPKIGSTLNRKTHFTVRQFGKRFMLEDCDAVHAVCATNKDKVLNIVENETSPKSWSFLFESGKYLGVTPQGRPSVYTNTDSEQTRWYPIVEQVQVNPVLGGGGQIPLNITEMDWSKIVLEGPKSNASMIVHQNDLFMVSKEEVMIVDLDSFIVKNRYSHHMELQTPYCFRHGHEIMVLDKQNVYQVSGELKNLPRMGIEPSISNGYCVTNHSNSVFVYSNNLYQFEIAKLKWTLITPKNDPPCNRTGTSLVYHLGKLILFGGQDEHGDFLNDINIFDLTTQEWSQPEDDGDIPQKTYSHSAIQYGGSMYVLNGYNGEEYISEMHELNLETFMWKLIETTVVPSGRVETCCVILEGNLLTFGGKTKEAFCDDFNMMKLNKQDVIEEVVQQDTSSVDWTNIKYESKDDMNRSKHSMVVYQNSLFLFGGLNAKGAPTQDLFQFENNEWKKLKQNKARQQPDPRSDHCSFVHKDTLYVLGGKGKNVEKDKNQIHEFDIPSLSWKIMTTKGTFSPRAQCAFTFLNGKLFVFGGKDNNGILNDLNCLEMDTGVWSCLDSTGPKIFGACMIPTKNGLMIYGGANENGPVDNVMEFDMNDRVWKVLETKNTPCVRIGFAFSQTDKGFMIFGGFDGKGWWDDAYEFDLETNTFNTIDKTLKTPVAREGASLSVIKNVAHLFGGSNAQTSFGTLDTLPLQ